VQAAASSESVEATGLLRVLNNIGIAQTLISSEELNAIFAEVGNERGQIPTTQMMQLL